MSEKVKKNRRKNFDFWAQWVNQTNYISNCALTSQSFKIFLSLGNERVNNLNVQRNLWMHINLQGHCRKCLKTQRKILCTFILLTLSLPRKILSTHNEVKSLNTSVRVLADIFQVTDHARTKLLKYRAYSQPLPTCYKSLQPRFEKGTCHVIMIVEIHPLGIAETHI